MPKGKRVEPVLMLEWARGYVGKSAFDCFTDFADKYGCTVQTAGKRFWELCDRGHIRGGYGEGWTFLIHEVKEGVLNG